MARPLVKELICPACGVVIAEATYRRWPPDLVLVAPSGVLLQPETVAVQMARAQAAEQAGDSEAATHVAFLERNLGELVYDLRCRNGHSTLRTMPQLVRSVRRAGGRWVDLRA